MWELKRNVVLPVQVSHPFETAEFDIIYGKGINALGCILDAAEMLKIVDRRVRTVLKQFSVH